MVKKDNPAGRLYEILDRAQKTRADNCHDGWKQTLDAGTDFITIQRLHYLEKLVQEVRKVVSERDDLNIDLYLHKYKNIEEIISVRNLNSSWQYVTSRLTDVTMLNLAFISDKLSGSLREKPLEEEELENIVYEINKLMEKLGTSSLFPELKKLIKDHLEVLLNAIDEYTLRGAQGLKEALEISIGSFIVNYKLNVFTIDIEAKEVKDYKTILSKMGDLIIKAYTLSTIGYKGLRALLEHLPK